MAVKRLPLLVIVALLAFAAGRVTSGASADVPYAWIPLRASAFTSVATPRAEPVIPSAGLLRQVLTGETDQAQLGVPQPSLPIGRQRPSAVVPSGGGIPHPSLIVRGISSWYATGPGGLTAAAGPALRVGDWRGRIVTICAGACIRVTLVDFCQCPQRLIDLSRDAFGRLADPSRGLLTVTARW